MPDVLLPVGNAGQHAQLKLAEQLDGTHALAVAVVAGGGGGGGGGTALVPTALLAGATATGPGTAVADSGRAPSFTGRVAGTGAVSATVQIQVRNDAAGEWVLLGTLTMSGTTVAADGFASAVRYLQYRANTTAISGTGAAVTVTMGS